MRTGVVLAAVCALTVVVDAAGGRPVDIATRARGAARVVVGKVADVHARYDVNEHGDQIIVTQALVEVEESLKGGAAQMLPVEVEGGTVGDITLSVSDMPTLRRGERAVFFLNAAQGPAGVHRPHRRGLGVLKLDSANRVPNSALTLGEVKSAVRAARETEVGR